MVSEFSADYACGQIIFNLKSSKLNYLVKETPYSLYITVRKTFVNNVKEATLNSVIISKDVSENEILLRKENGELKDKLNDLKTSNALIQVENEELEDKTESLVRDIICLEDNLEEAYLETRNSKGVVNKITVDNKKLIETLSDQKDLEENILILEHVVESKDQKIYNLEQEIKSMEETEEVEVLTEKDPNKEQSNKTPSNFSIFDEDLPSTSNCGTCDFTSNDQTNIEEHREQHSIESDVFEFICSRCDYETNCKEDLSKHYEVKHSLFTCRVCHMTIRAESNLQTHLCRVLVKNPTHQSFYSKGWYDANGCSPIFCKIKNQEVAWLHHTKCFIEPCAARKDFIENNDDEEKTNEEEFTNLRLDSLITNGEIDWKRFMKENVITHNY